MKRQATINPLPPITECDANIAPMLLTIIYGAEYVERTDSGAFRFKVKLDEQFETQNPYLKDVVQTLDLMPAGEIPEFLAKLKPGDVLNIDLT